MNNKKLLFVKVENEIDEYRFIYQYYDVVYQYNCTDDVWHSDASKLQDSEVIDEIKLFELEMAGSSFHLSGMDFPKTIYYEFIKAIFERGV